MVTMLALLVAAFATLIACEAYSYGNDDRYDRYGYRTNRYEYRGRVYQPYVLRFDDFYDLNYGDPNTEYRRFEYGRNAYGGRNKGGGEVHDKGGKTPSRSGDFASIRGPEQFGGKTGMDVIVEQKSDSGNDVKFVDPGVIFAPAPKIDVDGSKPGRGNQNFGDGFPPGRPNDNRGEFGFDGGRGPGGPRGDGPSDDSNFDRFPSESGTPFDQRRGSGRLDVLASGQGQGPESERGRGGQGPRRIDPNDVGPSTEQRGSIGVSEGNPGGPNSGREDLRESVLIGAPSGNRNQGPLAPRGGGDAPLPRGRGPVRGDPERNLERGTEPDPRQEFDSNNPRNPAQGPGPSPIGAPGRFDPTEDGSALGNGGNVDAIRSPGNRRRLSPTEGADSGTRGFPPRRPSDLPDELNGQRGSPDSGALLPGPGGPGGDAGRSGGDGLNDGQGSGGNRRGGGPVSGFPGSRPSGPVSGSGDFQQASETGGPSAGQNLEFR